MEPHPALSTKSVVGYIQPSTLAALFFSYVLITIIYRIFFHPLHRIPGPFPAKFTELWRTRKYLAGNWHSDILELHRKYGPVVRISPNEVSFVDKEALAQVYGYTKSAKKTSWYDTWKVPGADTSFFNETDPRHHSFLRKRVSATYSMTGVLQMEKGIQGVSDLLWKRFREFSRSGVVVGLHDWVPYFAFDVVGQVALGGPIGFIEASSDREGIIPAVHNYFFLASNIGYLPGQTRAFFNPAVQTVLGLLSDNGDGVNYLNAWMSNQMHRRRERGPPKDGEKGDMLDHFIAMKSTDGSPAPDSAVLAEMGNIIGAGADTTAIGIRSVIGQLMLHEDSYKRVQEEVDEAYRLHGFSDEPGSGGIPFSVAEKLPFLNACVREALRLHPSILYQLPRETPPQGLTIKDYYIPAGTTVSMSPLSHNRCPEIFGEDADAWRPERWIAGEGSTEQRVREMNKFDTTFGYGSRTCVGKNLALVEIHKFTAQLLHQFDVELVNKERPWVLKSMWFSDQGEMFVRIKERK
ncbi:Cytochrome P450 monooxygenase gsfF [Lasiodiplodia theobromae]|uniref:Cytochrome P450 monooxygenase gsfF n=1 Tax=Lasiodiplodia theobromae TaxID=45133 RepID=A0A5N5D7C3_9PEZI|nr:Cytochrome P450 monooxygenase gsfF [Lasiodiplodia theobromae]